MDILNKLEVLINYYERTRGVGHTVLMLEGTRLRSCAIMAHSHDYARELVRESGGNTAISWQDMSLLGVGYHLPLAIDNSAMYRICLEAAQEIASLRHGAAVLRQDAEKEIAKLQLLLATKESPREYTLGAEE